MLHSDCPFAHCREPGTLHGRRRRSRPMRRASKRTSLGAVQVRNLRGCIKVAVDFVAPESISQCLRLTEERRELALRETEPAVDRHHQDKLQARTRRWARGSVCVSTRRGLLLLLLQLCCAGCGPCATPAHSRVPWARAPERPACLPPGFLALTGVLCYCSTPPLALGGPQLQAERAGGRAGGAHAAARQEPQQPRPAAVRPGARWAAA